jgi:glycosyltransferase involved in cell wall biosynthesis
MSHSYSCLIPFYNEAEKVLEVLKVLSKIRKFDQIIAVDDGSSDDASKEIKKNFPKVKLVKLKKNQGKAAAVAAGLKYVESDYVMLFDADVNNIKPREVRKALRKVARPEIDLIILNKVDPNPDYSLTNKFSVYSRIACVFSGERVLKTNDLKIILAQKPEGYQLEPMINQYMMENNKTAKWVKSSIKHPYAYSNGGAKQVAKKYSAMALQIIQGVGVVNFIEQLAAFCTEEA